MTTRIPANPTAANFAANRLSTETSTKVASQTTAAPTELSRPAVTDARHGIVAGGCHRPDDFFPLPRPRPLPFPFPGGHCGTPSFPSKPGGCWTPLDLSALVELGKLDQKKGPVSAEEMTEAIKNGTADLDGQAASGEYRAFSEWAQKNGQRLTPEAKQVMDIYSKYAAQSQARGESGISQADHAKMLEEMSQVGDQGAKRALAGLDRLPSPISGRDMARAIERGARDADGQTKAEVNAFREWAQKNSDKLSPEAKEVLGIFEKHANKATADGDKDLSRSEWKNMLREFRGVGDVSAKKALEKLDKENGPVSGEDMLAAIKEGVSDKDGHSTTSELREFQKWAQKNSDRLTPEARKVLATYEKYAKSAGPAGMSQGQFDKMVKEMGQFKTFRDDSMRTALEKLDDKNGRISAKDLTEAIKTGAGDFDGQAAGVEFADLQKWARENYSRLGPDARKVLDIYEKYATRAMAQGQTGIANSDFQRMLREMSRVGEPVLRPMHLVG